MKNTNKNPILITGSHRSGSTWTGRMIAHAPNIAYIHEPFNLHHRRGICKADFKYHFPYVCMENESLFFKDLKDCLNFRYHLLEDLKTSKSMKDLTRSILSYFRFTEQRVLKKRPLIKDPIAFFSAEWLANRFNMNVVVLIRHPAAFAGSLKKAKWFHPFDDFLMQPLLIKHHLYEYKAEIEEFVQNKKSIIDQAILLWKIIHNMILKFQNKHPDWIFVKHEDLSMHPIEEFEKLYNRLGLAFSDEIKKKIEVFSFPYSKKNIFERGKSKVKKLLEKIAGNDSYQYKRNSKINIWNWKNRLTNDEVKRIEENTYSISSKFYSKKDWEGYL